ncbi:hypothetical protein ACWCOP_09880 [Maricaulaceae bacterium MS644]
MKTLIYTAGLALASLSKLGLSTSGLASVHPINPPSIELHGEIHGVANSLDAFIGAVTEAMADSGTVVAAFELPANGQPIFDQWWTGSAESLSPSEVYAMGWCDLSDGRTSADLVNTMASLRELADQGGLSVRFIDTRFTRPPLRSLRDTSSRGSAELAIALARTAAENPEARILALIGNAHARRTPLTMPDAMGGGQMITAGHLLAQDVVSVAYLYEEGARLGCDLDGCGISELASNQANLERAGDAYDLSLAVGPARPATSLAEAGYCSE